ncbi:NAD(P)H-binding protein [Chitinophaga barathri]|uniref:NAD-dependent epimerase/dehydratase family protein n=1 Tax=Chitinophaga barathri TaxID=1647451 RepID=A0A3N4MGC6_9BACT|nr:NAD(P)H-binding protein [Chitinophaga barathri]RPD42475.1 NAD-dependent epimerase/dehydratase family protein [Chitinophaga barathri]
MPGTAIVIGATGLIGQLLVQQLLDDGHYSEVRTITRKPLPLQHPKLKQTITSLENSVELEAALQGDALFCCIGTTIKKAGSQAAFTAVDHDIPVQCGHIARKNGVAQYHLVSAIGAKQGARNFYLRTKGATEAALAEMGFPSLYIYRPSLLLGDRKEVRFGEQAGQWLMPVFSFLLQGGMKKYRPVKAATVAETMLNKSKEKEGGVHTVYFNV